MVMRSAHDKAQDIEEPCEAKVSSTVLKTSGAGDSLAEFNIIPDPQLPGYHIQASVTTKAETGVEMEALTAVSIAALTLYDMAKGLEKSIQIESIRLLSKTGGKSGDYRGEG